MQFDILLNNIEKAQQNLQSRALQSINQFLVIRNWLIGNYIVEFEQKGEDRAKYGEKLIENLAKELKKKNLKGMSETNLKLFRQFSIYYPQFYEYINIFLTENIINKDITIRQIESDESKKLMKY